MEDKHGEQWRSQPSEAKAAMAQPCELLPNDGAAESNPKPSEAMATPFHNHAERWRSRVPRKTGLMNFALRNLGVGSVKKGVLFERSEFHPL